jgi:predicted nucleotidyltransferase
MVIDAETLEKTLQNYIFDVKKTMPIKMERVFLFGSYAKGSPDEWSDVDVCFFFERFDGKSSIDIGMELLDAAYKYLPEMVIEPHHFLTKELENDNPFVKEILRTGREIKIDD